MTQEPREPDTQAPAETGAAPPPPADAGGAPPQQDWQSQPHQPAPPPPAAGAAPAATLPAGPIEGTQIADFVTRLVAYVIDGVIIGIAAWIVWAILWATLPIGIDVIVQVLAAGAISAGYFIYMWTNRRQTVGMMAMKLLVVQDGSGATLTQDQAVRRWVYLGLPLALVTLFSVSAGLGFGGLGFLYTLGVLAALAALGWLIYLAYTTSQDPRKQGVHDKAVNSVVVSYGPSPFSQQAPR